MVASSTQQIFPLETYMSYLWQKSEQISGTWIPGGQSHRFGAEYTQICIKFCRVNGA